MESTNGQNYVSGIQDISTNLPQHGMYNKWNIIDSVIMGPFFYATSAIWISRVLIFTPFLSEKYWSQKQTSRLKELIDDWFHELRFVLLVCSVVFWRSGESLIALLYTAVCYLSLCMPRLRKPILYKPLVHLTPLPDLLSWPIASSRHCVRCYVSASRKGRKNNNIIR